MAGIKSTPTPNDNVYITGLPGGTTEEQLRTAFSAYGEVVQSRLMPQGLVTERAALVRYANPEDARRVVQGLNGHVPEGMATPIKVRFAGPGRGAQAGGGPGGGPDGGYGHAKAAPSAALGLGPTERMAPYSASGNPKASAVPTDNLYVYGLPPDIDQQTLNMIFAQYGQVVQIRVVRPGQGKGAALIRYCSVEEALAVKNLMHNTIPEGLHEPVQVEFAGPPAGRPGAFGPQPPGAPAPAPIAIALQSPLRRSSGDGADPPPSANLYVTGMPSDIDQTTFLEIFGQFGSVVRCKIVRPGQGPGAALVEYSSIEEAALVRETVNGTIPPGMHKPVAVNYADPSKQKGGKGTIPVPIAVAPFSQEDLMSYSQLLQRPATAEEIQAEHAEAQNRAWHLGQCSMKMVVKGFEATGGLPGGSNWNDEGALHVSNLPPDCQNVDLYRLFGAFGAIAPRGVRAILWEDGTCRGYGYVSFLDPLAAQTAMAQMNGVQLPDGTFLQVKPKASA